MIEPSLSKTQTKYIERLLAIYLEEDSSTMNQSIQDEKIHTLEDYYPQSVVELTEESDAKGSIWKQTPGELCDI